MIASTEYSKIFPIQEINDKYIINGNGDITVGIRVEHKEIFGLSEEEIIKDHEQYCNLLKSLPNNTIFHKQDYYFTENFYDVNSFDQVVSIKYNKAYYKTKPVRKHYSVIFLTFITQEGKLKRSLFALLDYLFSRPFNKLDEVIPSIVRNVESFLNAITSISSITSAKLYDNLELKQLIYNYHTFDFSQTNSIGNIPSINIKKDGFAIGNKNVGVISLLDEGGSIYLAKKSAIVNPELFENGNDYPATLTAAASMMFPVSLGLPIDHVVNTVIHVKDNDVLVRNIFQENMFINMLASLNLGIATSKKSALNVYKQALEEFGEKGCTFASNLIIYHENQQLLNKWLDLASTTLKNINSCTSLIENADAFQIFWANIPGNAQFNIRNKYSIVDVAACYLPRETYNKSDNEGFYCVDVFGNPIRENLLFSDSTSNKNIVVFGPSGSGKTNWLCWFTDNNLNSNHDVIIINVKPDYVNHCKLNNGIYVNTAVDEYKGINPFYTYNDNGFWTLSTEKANLLRAILSHIWKKKERMSNDENSVLSDVIEKYYHHVNSQKIEVPTFKTFYEFIDVYIEKFVNDENRSFLNFQSLKLGLKPFYSGAYKDIFDVKKQVDLMNERYVVFDLMAVLKDELLFDVYLYYVIDFAMTKIVQNKNSGKFTNIILDECIDSMKGQGGDFVGEQFRKIRSMNGSIAICTQGISYLDAVSDLVKDSIKTNCDIKILLDHSAATSDFPKLQNYLSLSDNEMELLGSISKGKHYRQWFLKKGIDNAKLLRNENSLFSNAAYSTSPKDVKQIEDEQKKLQERGIDNIEIAIQNHIDNNINPTKN
ncbi:MAG: DUF3875 domain-containing protein [Flavobacteriales bacterium]|nr:DUF3875 domain-containing protein [Flavobacteriales bacterium]